jgi:predicted Zn-dependent peptidase
MDLLFHSLSNGIRLVHHRIPGEVAYCGLIINTGSRDEEETEHGIAHFIEHMLFKGTKKRKAYFVLSRLENVGGELNAYTTKEETAIYASFMKTDYERAIEIIGDVVFNPALPIAEIEKEKDVIIEEINSYLDNPGELIFDEFEEMIFADQPIGHNILGTSASVKSFNQKKLAEFISKNYHTDQMVFCSVGDIQDDKIIRLFRKYFEAVPGNTKTDKASIPWFYKAASSVKKLDTVQNHCIIGNIAYDLKSKKRLVMFLLNNILGGQGLNSRLNLSLREKKGLTYNVESVYNPYRDTGSFSIYFGTDTVNLERSIKIVYSELDRLRKSNLGVIQLSKAKTQIKGYLARGYENHESLMLSLGKSLLVFDRIETLEETCRKIDYITSSELLEAANEIFNPPDLSTLIYK